MKTIFQNKLVRWIVAVLLVIFVVDMLINIFLQNIIAANSSMATASDPIAMIGDQIASITEEWLSNDAPNVGTKVKIIVEKSGWMIFAYVLTLLVGLAELVFGVQILRLSKKEESFAIRKTTMILATLVLVASAYNIIASIMKFSSGVNGTFEYALTQADVNVIATAKVGMEADIEKMIREYANNPLYKEIMTAEVNRLAGLGVVNPTTQAAKNLFGDAVITNLAPKHGQLLGGNLAYIIGGDFSENITTWLSGESWESFLTFIFSSTGLVGLSIFGLSGVSLTLLTKYRVTNMEVPKY